MDLINEIKTLIKEPLESAGVIEFEVSFVRENNTNYLRVFVDKENNVTLEDIVQINDLISPLLDKADLIKDAYILDVSSFGAEKPIKVETLEKYVGRYVNIHLTSPYKGMNILEGNLEEVNDESITITFKEKTRLIKAIVKRNDIDKARLAIKF